VREEGPKRLSSFRKADTAVEVAGRGVGMVRGWGVEERMQGKGEGVAGTKATPGLRCVKAKRRGKRGTRDVVITLQGICLWGETVCM